MLSIIETILPVFLIVALGFCFRKWGPLSPDFWPQFSMFGYYTLFPALIFHAVITADFSKIELGQITLVSFVTFSIMPILVLFAWPLLRATGIAKPAYTTIFQTTSRWHGFMALAIAEKMFGATGISFVAIVMLVVIVPINLANVIMLVSFDGKEHSISDFIKQIFTNPIIAATMLALIVNIIGIEIYTPIVQAIDFIARSSLGLGLVMIGAGLRVRDLVQPNAPILIAVTVKLIILPILAYLVGVGFGLAGADLSLLVLCCAVPAAANGYVLAQKLGGDAPLYASILSFQIILSFFTLPIILSLVS